MKLKKWFGATALFAAAAFGLAACSSSTSQGDDSTVTVKVGGDESQRYRRSALEQGSGNP